METGSARPRNHRMAHVRLLCAVVLAAPAPCARPSTIERISDLAWVIRDDAGVWSNGSMGNTHQLQPDYCAKKSLDLGGVSEDAWRQISAARLSIFFCVRDYSWNNPKIKPNGLDEAFEIVVNGRVHRHETRSGVPVYVEKKSMTDAMRWHDFPIPKEELVRGPNEILLRKAPTPGKAPDDYLYLGIDRSVPCKNSWVTLAKGAPWRQDRLNVPGGAGEYMVRLYLLQGQTEFVATWFPPDNRTRDEHQFIAYAGAHGDAARVEWNPLGMDPLSPLVAVAETTDDREFSVQWLDETGEARTPPVKARGPRFETRLPAPLAFRPSGIRFPKNLALKQVSISGALDYHPLPRRVDIAPRVSNPKGRPADRRPACRVESGRIVFENASLRCEFTVGKRLQFSSLYNDLAAAEMLRHPQDCAIFVVETAGRRYAGSRDFACESIDWRSGETGLTAVLHCAETGLRANLSVKIDDALRMGLELVNKNDSPIDLKVAFPHLSGLAVSDATADDYYFFPWGGGIISDSPAILRRGYGDHEALYQMMDIFSPARGAGLAVRCLDDDGRHKILALRKHVAGQVEADGDKCYLRTAEEYKWTNSLEAIEGTGLAFEYLRRTRGPGESFRAKDAAIEPHAGDWHAAMRNYADWCHRTWRFRPYPSRLDGIVNMIAAGWGQSVLFRDGAYRTDIIRPMTDCVELMSWWDWSTLGPWSTPFERLHEVLSETTIKRWQSYFVKDPVTGQKMWNNQPGDYDGYNERFGGLAAFRKAIGTYRDLGAMVTLYTDPFRMDDASKVGRAHGKAWGVVEANGKHSTAYEVWNPCHDCPDVRRWVAGAMGRVMRETGADGIRLDEYGHRGWACFSTLHEHTFAERGCTEWQRAVAEATKMIHAAMDETKPGSVLTTEHPGYDYLMQYLEGCITYDLTVQASPLRPLECNTQRFYFPECRAYELDHRGADRKDRKKFWNAVASFGRYFPEAMYHVLHENGDAFGGRKAEPLVPTLAQFLYANRFDGPGKTLFTLYNAMGHSFEGPALGLKPGQGQHLFDLLGSREVAAADGVVRIFLPRDDVACLALLPDQLSASRSDASLDIAVAAATDGDRLRLCDKDGKVLSEQSAHAGNNSIGLQQIEGNAACVKLMRDNRLIDAEAVPISP